jgi:hypothetical protein
MGPITLTKDQEISSIRLKPADNGGCSLEYEIYTPALSNSESSWENKMEVYTDEEMETVVFPRILEMYKADYANSVARAPKDEPVRSRY